MNQDFHVLCSMLGAYKKSSSKKETDDYIEKNVAALVCLDAFRARIDRNATHFIAQSYWKMPESLDKLKNSSEEDMQFHITERARLTQGLCVNELCDFKTFVRQNLNLFSDENAGAYGKTVLIHCLQDFYMDVVWRLMYNFENQGKVILKTQDSVTDVDPDITPSEKSPKTVKPKYEKLDETVKKSDSRFREEYRDINYYASYLMTQRLQSIGFDVFDDNQTDIFSRLRPEVQSRYPEDVFLKSGKYFSFSEDTKKALRDPEEAEKLKKKVQSIFAGNVGLFVQGINNCIKSTVEAEKIVAELTKASKKGSISEEDLDRIFAKQIRIAQNVNNYQRQVYTEFSQEQDKDAK